MPGVRRLRLPLPGPGAASQAAQTPAARLALRPPSDSDAHSVAPERPSADLAGIMMGRGPGERARRARAAPHTTDYPSL
jgi:hypothetical protein